MQAQLFFASNSIKQSFCINVYFNAFCAKVDNISFVIWFVSYYSPIHNIFSVITVFFLLYGFRNESVEPCAFSEEANQSLHQIINNIPINRQINTHLGH